MKIENLKTAMAEAERFLVAARIVRAMPMNRELASGSLIYVAHGRESAAVRRASLDLSRALADLRRRGA